MTCIAPIMMVQISNYDYDEYMYVSSNHVPEARSDAPNGKVLPAGLDHADLLLLVDPTYCGMPEVSQSLSGGKLPCLFEDQPLRIDLILHENGGTNNN
eukprot:scaffold3007_cov157-Amphora_coffeaeformis.AAC.7